jgi:hypothetical protein
MESLCHCSDKCCCFHKLLSKATKSLWGLEAKMCPNCLSNAAMVAMTAVEKTNTTTDGYDDDDHDDDDNDDNSRTWAMTRRLSASTTVYVFSRFFLKVFIDMSLMIFIVYFIVLYRTL